MGFQVSPGVQTKEVDLINNIPGLAVSNGGMVGTFEKGPIDEVVTIGSEAELLSVFGKPNGNNFENWFSASNFLQYSNVLHVVRAASGVLNATANAAGLLIKNKEIYDNTYADGSASVGSWAAQSAGTLGNGLGVSICQGAAAFEEDLSSSNSVNDATAAAGDVTITVDDGTAFAVGDIVHFQETDGQEYEVTSIATHVLTIRQKDDPNGGGLVSAIADNTLIRRRWRFNDLFDSAPGTSTWATDKGLTAGTDEMHIVVYDTTSSITGFDVDVAGNRTNGVIETYDFVSKHPNAKTPHGGTNYYVDIINSKSTQVYWMDHSTAGTDWGTNLVSGGADTTFVDAGLPIVDACTGGTDDYAATVAELKSAYDYLANTETVDVSLVIGGSTVAGSDGVTHAANIINLCEKRKDCVGFVSPRRADVVGVTSNITQTNNVKDFFDLLNSSSYIVFDSGYKYMYDKYNDVYRWVPLNADIAGLCANTDNVASPWFSPGGMTRGQIRGAVKLAYNPSQTQRDILYPARVNPVVTFPGQGTVLFGDKTGLARPSAFDRINVRRLFIVLEKAISTAAKAQMFEINDDFSRTSFKNMVEPFLRDVQGGRGITDFKVVCDSSNNTDQVIDSNEFVAEIFIKPSRSINFITLSFVAVRTGVAFSEIGG